MVDFAMQTYGTIPNLKIRLIFAEKNRKPRKSLNVNATKPLFSLRAITKSVRCHSDG